ncbi:MAG TPA: hypothetical protein VHV77_07300 [Pirellulales bacterium]|jgi:ABC-type sugar transport system permease subunit|nr:hypothetical protein [Pirellulales bacterium]
MPQPPSTRYVKLPGGGLFALGFSRNWLADDHLLAVSSFLGVEHYKRYYFKDIEALVVRRTAGRLVWNIAFFSAAIFLTLVVGSIFRSVHILQELDHSGPNRAAGISFVMISSLVVAICLLLALGNTLRGRTCAVYIQTSSGLERLTALLRIRAADLAISRLRRAVEAAEAAAESAAPAWRPAG